MMILHRERDALRSAQVPAAGDQEIDGDPDGEPIPPAQPDEARMRRPYHRHGEHEQDDEARRLSNRA